MSFTNIITVSILSFFLSLAWWQEPAKPIDANSSTWEKLDSLRDIRQSQTLFKQSDAIFKDALTKEDYATALKALNYKFTARQLREENPLQKNYDELNTLIAKDEFPLNQIAASLQAELLNSYYQNQRYRIDQRQNTPNMESDKLEDWTKQDFEKAIVELHLKAIQNANELENINSRPYEILFPKNDRRAYLSTNLYHILFQRAFAYFSSHEFENTNEFTEKLLSDEVLFSSIDEYTKINIDFEDFSSQHTASLHLLQIILEQVKASGNEILLAHYNNIRLEKAYEISLLEEKDSLLLNAYHDFSKELKSPSSKNYWKAELAKFYEVLSTNTEWAKQETKITFRKTALQIAESILAEKDTAHWYNEMFVLKQEILKEHFSANLPESIFPEQKSLVKVNYKNKTQVFWEIFSSENFEEDYRNRDKAIILSELKDNEALHTGNFQLEGSEDLFDHSKEFSLPGLKTGNYLLVLSDSSIYRDTSQLQILNFNVTNLAVVNRRASNNAGIEWIVRNKKTGEALKGAEVQVFFREYDYNSRKQIYKKGPTLKTNGDGLCAWLPPAKNRGSIYIDVTYGDDKVEKLGSYYYYRENKSQPRSNIQFFTDRSIYRPGQRVHFKAIGIFSDEDEKSLKENWKVLFRFKDANYQEIDKTELTSNEYGSFSGSFLIPESGLNGNFRIETNYGSQMIKVEEYQRPKFELTLSPLEGFVKLGDSIEVKGNAKSFAGIAIQNAELKYQVVQMPQYRPYYSYRSYYPNIKGKEIASGNLSVDENGEFSIRFLSENKNKVESLNYTVKIQATDITGETQEAERSYTIQKSAFSISANIPNQIFTGEKNEWKINTHNCSSEAVKTTGSIKVYKLKTPEKVVLPRSGQAEFTSISEKEFKQNWPYLAYENEDKIENWEELELVFETKVETEATLSPDFLKNIAAGAYKVKIELSNNTGENNKLTKYFTAVDLQKMKMPYPMPYFFHVSNTSAQVGESVNLTIGSGYKNAAFELVILHKNGEERSRYKIDNELEQIPIKIKKEYEGNIGIAVYMIRNGRTFNSFQSIQVPFENRKLSLELESMRKVLRPGADEKWTVSIKDENGKTIEAELLAGMYDASLDKIYNHGWYFNPLPSYSFNQYGWINAQGSKTHNYFTDMQQNYKLPFPYLEAPIIPDFEFYFNAYGYYYNGIRARTASLYKESAEVGSVEEVVVEMDMEEEMEMSPDSDKVGLAEYAGDVEEAQNQEQQAQEEIQVRSNFAETAFFFPQLESNSDGKANFSFTVPDAITRWKFMALAHSKNLQFGQLTETFEAKKEVMIEAQPLVFLRQGDQILFRAKITNMSEEPQEVTANLQWINPYSKEDFSKNFLAEAAQKKIKIDAGKVQEVAWLVNVPNDFDQPLMYRVKARSNNFTDGEEKLLPVLENNIALTKSVAFQLDKSAEQIFKTNDLLDLPEDARIQKIQLEINPNPHWYVIQALPYLSESDYRGSDAIFNRLYAQSISAYLANQNPEIEALFQEWGDKLKSPLQREEGDAISDLGNTPWLQSALRDEKRMKNIAQLFDINQLEYEKGRSIRDLLKIQSPNGGWPWIQSMPDSRFITQKIVLGFARLKDKNILDFDSDRNLKNALVKAIKYLDAEMLEDYEEIQKLKKKEGNHLSAANIQYLLIRSYFNIIPLAGKEKAAHFYFMQQADKYWNKFSLQLQAQIALILHRNNSPETAKLIVEALKQNSISNELGTYWKEGRSPYWYYSPIERHVAILEAIFEIEGNSKFIEKMQQWLLNEKRTNNWGNGSATADACYAFLLDNSQKWVQENKTQVWLNGTNLKADKIMKDGSGVLVFTWKGKAALDKFKGDLKILNQQDNLIWGSVSVSFESPLEAVEAYGDELKVSKEIFVKSTASNKEKLKPLKNTETKPGEELWVRLKVEANRNFDYVHLKDLRAAGSTSKNILSGSRWQGGLYYYQQNKDASMHFFIPNLQKGSYVIEYPLFVSSTGEFSCGPAQIQCAYATEFEGYSGGSILKSRK